MGEMSTLRQRCFKLKDQNRKQRTLIKRQKAQIERIEDRLQGLRYLLSQQAPKRFDANQIRFSSLKMSVTSETEDGVSIGFMDGQESQDAESITPFPECSSSNWSKSKAHSHSLGHEPVVECRGTIEAEWSNKYDVVLETMRGKMSTLSLSMKYQIYVLFY